MTSSAGLTDQELDKFWMMQAGRIALFHHETQAQRMFGCVIVQEDVAIGAGYGSGSELDPLSHSECDAIRAAYRLQGPLTKATLYSTLEPCMMCCGAILHAKIGRVVWGAYRSDFGDRFRRWTYNAHTLLRDTTYPPVTKGGVLRQPCIDLLHSAGEPKDATGTET